MTKDECVQRWKELNGAPKYIKLSSLVFVKQDDDHIFYTCPFSGSADHYATVARMGGMVVQCYHCEQVSILIRPDAISIIQEEEIKFKKMLDRFHGTLKDQYTPEAAFKLITSQGCPIELLEDRTDRAALETLMRQHQELSRSSAKFRKEVFA